MEKWKIEIMESVMDESVIEELEVENEPTD